MLPPIEHETNTTIPVYEEAKTETVRALIKETSFTERAIIKDLLRLEHYATNQLRDTREAMDLRHLTQRYPDHAAAILAEVDSTPEPTLDERESKMRRNHRELRIRRQYEHLKERIERESWKRAGGLE